MIGCTIKNPSLLEQDGKYFYNEDDFMSDFHRVIFGCVNNLYQMGAKKVTTVDIENYLESRSKAKQIYLASKGNEWIAETVENADLANFEYYYNRMKKMTLLREYESCGMDVRFLYNPDVFLYALTKYWVFFLQFHFLNQLKFRHQYNHKSASLNLLQSFCRCQSNQ